MSDTLMVEVLSRIGEVQQQLGIVQGQNVLILAHQTDADNSRRAIHQKLDQQHADHVALAGRMTALEGRVDTISPLVQQHEAAEQRRIGQATERQKWLGLAGKVVTKGRAALLAGVAAVGGFLTWLATAFPWGAVPPPKP